MADVAELLVLLTGDSSGAKRALSDTGKGLSNLDSSSSHSSSLFSKLGKTMVAALEVAATAAAALAGAGAVAVKMAMDFQTSQTQLVTGAGESQKNLAMVSAGILAMAGTVGQSAEDLSKGMFLIESAGYHGAAGLAVLKAAAEGAAVGGAQMTTVANALTTALHDYNLPASDANRVTSALVQTVADGKTNLEDLAGSLGKVMPVASALGISLQQVTGAMATMTNAGLTARFAATHLQTALLALSAPNATAAKSMAQVGLTTQEVKNALDGPGGLSEALSLIEGHVGTTFPAGSVASVTALKNIMGGVTGYSTALMLSGKNSAEFESNVKNIGKVLDGSNKQVQGFSQASHDFSFALKSAGDAAQAAMISFGTKLLPVVTAVAQWLGQEIPVAVTVLNNAFTWIGTNVIPVVVAAFKAMWDWVEENRKLLLTIAGVLLGVVATGFKVLADGVTFIVQHKSVFLDLGIAVAAIFVIGHAYAWANDAISNIGKVLSAVKNAPSSLLSFFTGSGKTSAIGSDVKNLAGDVQKVYVVNMAEGGLGTAAGAAEGEAPVAEGALAGEGGVAAAGAGVMSLAVPLALVVAGSIGLVSLIQSLKGAGTIKTDASTGKITLQGDNANSSVGQAIQQQLDAQITTQLQAEASAMHETVKQLLAQAATQTTLTGMIGKTAPQIGAGFVTLYGKLQAMGLSFGQSVSASDALQGYISKYGPLTSAQMEIFYDDVKAGVTDAADIALSLKTANENMTSIPLSSSQVASGLASLAKAIPGIKNVTGSGLGFVRDKGGPITEDVYGWGATTGLPWRFHKDEMVVPKSQLHSGAAASGSATGAGGTSIEQHFHINGAEPTAVRTIIRQENSNLIRMLQAGRK